MGGEEESVSRGGRHGRAGGREAECEVDRDVIYWVAGGGAQLESAFQTGRRNPGPFRLVAIQKGAIAFLPMF
jgi:hypothetical protein